MFYILSNLGSKVSLDNELVFYKKQNSNKDDDQTCINVRNKVQNHAKQFHSKVNEHPLTYVNTQNMKNISILLHTMYVGTR